MDNKNADGSTINSGGKTGTIRTLIPNTETLDHASAPARTTVPAPPKPWVAPTHG